MLIEEFTFIWNQCHDLIFRSILPILYALDCAQWADDAYIATEWFQWGLLQIGLMILILIPLEQWIPVEIDQFQGAKRVDIFYTLIHRLGLFRLVFFLCLDPFLWKAQQQLRNWGWTPWDVETWWSIFAEYAILSFLVYLVILDFFDYLYHRASHHFEAWWALHAVHHSQTELSLWSDNRNHLIDDVFRDVVLAVISWGIGVSPAQFIGLMAVSNLLQSLQHANVNLSFGRWLSYIIISPRFHRLHHAVGLGHESRIQAGVLGGCNFGILFPWWDMLFKTADFSNYIYPTGIQSKGVDYGAGFWSQQWLGLLRFGKALRFSKSTLKSTLK